MDAADLIDHLRLEPHPEGGHFRRTFLDPEGRASSILYLLRAGERSHWHRVDAVEIWNHCGGGPLALSVSVGDGPPDRLVLGSPPVARPQAIVPAGAWQRAEPVGDLALVSCVVVPAFRWEGFELAPAGWEPRDVERGDEADGVGSGVGNR